MEAANGFKIYPSRKVFFLAIQPHFRVTLLPKPYDKNNNNKVGYIVTLRKTIRKTIRNRRRCIARITSWKGVFRQHKYLNKLWTGKHYKQNFRRFEPKSIVGKLALMTLLFIYATWKNQLFNYSFSD